MLIKYPSGAASSEERVTHLPPVLLLGLLTEPALLVCAFNIRLLYLFNCFLPSGALEASSCVRQVHGLITNTITLQCCIIMCALLTFEDVMFALLRILKSSVCSFSFVLSYFSFLVCHLIHRVSISGLPWHGDKIIGELVSLICKLFSCDQIKARV